MRKQIKLLQEQNNKLNEEHKKMQLALFEIKKKLKDGEKKNQLKELIILDQIY